MQLKQSRQSYNESMRVHVGIVQKVLERVVLGVLQQAVDGLIERV